MTPWLGRITRVVLAVVESMEALKDAAPLTGMGIGTSTYVGTARVVRDAVEALAVMEPGDVVVAPYTAPTYNAVLAMAGAIVTEEGGLLCHAAVIARELGLPAVIGAADAMSSIPDGATVEVDPVAGRVRILTA
jgi:pyruvate,water dikinase